MQGKTNFGMCLTHINANYFPKAQTQLCKTSVQKLVMILHYLHRMHSTFLCLAHVKTFLIWPKDFFLPSLSLCCIAEMGYTGIHKVMAIEPKIFWGSPNVTYFTSMSQLVSDILSSHSGICCALLPLLMWPLVGMSSPHFQERPSSNHISKSNSKATS